jgi:hypothetical protein
MPDPEKCRDCQSLLNPGAIRCTSCGALQNYRRYVAGVTVAISLFLGAATAWSIVYPFAKEQLRSDFDVRLERVGANAGAYTVMVENRGRRPAIVKYVNIFFGERVEFLNIEEGGNIIKAGDTRFLKLIWPNGADRPKRPVDYSRRWAGTTVDRCEILVSVFAGEERLLEINELKSNCLGDFDDFLTGEQSVG